MNFIDVLGELLAYAVIFEWGYDRCNISHGFSRDKWWKWGLLIVSLIIVAVLKSLVIK